MIVSHQHRFVFLRTQKTAGTSVEIALSRHCGDDDIVTKLVDRDDALRERLGGRNRQNDLVPLRAYRVWEAKEALRRRERVRAFNHMPARRVKRLIGSAAWRDYLTFTVVRNPYDAAISYYFWRTKKLPEASRPTLSEFLRSDQLTRLTWNWEIYTIRDTVVADVVCRYESLAEDIAATARRIGLPADLDLPHAKSAHRADRSAPSDILSDDDTKVIRSRFRREIETFGYDLR